MTFLENAVTYRIDGVYVFDKLCEMPDICLNKRYTLGSLDDIIPSKCRKEFYGIDWLQYHCEEYSIMFKGHLG